MKGTILVIAELSDDILTRHSREVVSAARQLAPDRLVVAAPGADSARIAEALRSTSGDQIVPLAHPLLARYSADGYTAVLHKLVEDIRPELVLLPHSYRSRDFAPKLAARCGHSLITDCIGFENLEERLVFVRQAFQGRANANVTLAGPPPHFVTFQAGCFAPDMNDSPGHVAETLNFDIAIEGGQIRSATEAPFQEAVQAVDLSQASVIVAVGRGIKSAENIAMARKLADLLGGELAATRAVCDEGWLPIDHQVGSSGQTVSPKLYIALGISGATQHVVGMKTAETIVAINKDTDAPIFKIADYGIVGDLFEIVPALIETLEIEQRAH